MHGSVVLFVEEYGVPWSCAWLLVVSLCLGSSCWRREMRVVAVWSGGRCGKYVVVEVFLAYSQSSKIDVWRCSWVCFVACRRGAWRRFLLLLYVEERRGVWLSDNVVEEAVGCPSCRCQSKIHQSFGRPQSWIDVWAGGSAVCLGVR